MLRYDGRYHLRRRAGLQPIEFHRDGQWRGVGERIPIKLWCDRERRQRFAIVRTIVIDVGARDFQERVDRRLNRTAFGRKIVL